MKNNEAGISSKINKDQWPYQTGLVFWGWNVAPKIKTQNMSYSVKITIKYVAYTRQIKDKNHKKIKCNGEKRCRSKFTWMNGI